MKVLEVLEVFELTKEMRTRTTMRFNVSSSSKVGIEKIWEMYFDVRLPSRLPFKSEFVTSLLVVDSCEERAAGY